MLVIGFLVSWILAGPLLALAEDSKDPAPCTAHSGQDYYDLNPLRQKTDFAVLPELGARNITLNICGPVIGETWKLDEPDQVAGFYRGEHSDISIGRVNTTVSVVHGHPMLVFSDGTECQGSTGLKRSSIVRFICDQTVFGRGTPKLVAQLPPDDDAACAFFIEWRTHVACPTNKPGSHWGPIIVFAMIVLVTITCYFAAAVFYNRLVLGLRGREQLPTFSFAGLTSLKDFLMSCFSRRDTQRGQSWGSWNGDRSGFGRLARDEEEEAIMNGRFSIDEEDEGARDATPLQTNGLPAGMGSDGAIRL
ncbi:mannose 6-phosphate receptor domain-containing protein [Clavulina sp. PMI_390]|nr:mannose 6-phosphate receptor domain-containing protein [Clavulina sp. PMI_390]